MKYIRTKDGIYKYDENNEKDFLNYCSSATADNIKELCDEFVLITDKDEHFIIGHPYKEETDKELLGAIWTSKGLIYVAKLNDKGELELL